MKGKKPPSIIASDESPRFEYADYNLRHLKKKTLIPLHSPPPGSASPILPQHTTH